MVFPALLGCTSCPPQGILRGPQGAKVVGAPVLLLLRDRKMDFCPFVFNKKMRDAVPGECRRRAEKQGCSAITFIT